MSAEVNPWFGLVTRVVCAWAGVAHKAASAGCGAGRVWPEIDFKGGGKQSHLPPSRMDHHRFEPRRRTPLSGFSSPADSLRLASSSRSSEGPSLQRAPARQLSPPFESATPV